MTCDECEYYQKSGYVAYYRWKIANVAVLGCPKHVKEIFDVLNKTQREGRL